MNKEEFKMKEEQAKEKAQKKEKEAAAKVKEFNEKEKAKVKEFNEKEKAKMHEKSEKAKAHRDSDKEKAHQAAEKAKANWEEATSPEHVESNARAHGEAMGAEFGKVTKVVDEFKSGYHAGMNGNQQSKKQEAPKADKTEKKIEK